MKRRTPAARALVGALALRDGATINRAFALAGYMLTTDGSLYDSRRDIRRGGRVVGHSRHAGKAAAWLTRLGRKLEALSVSRYGCTCDEERYCPYHQRMSAEGTL